eukprot:scaffold46655_cov60-Phaeocystis_antarctica.AAC.1
MALPLVRRCCPWNANGRSRMPRARMPRTDDALRRRHCLFVWCRQLHTHGDSVHLHLLMGLSGHAPACVRRRLCWAAGAARMPRTDDVLQRRHCLVV